VWEQSGSGSTESAATHPVDQVLYFILQIRKGVNVTNKEIIIMSLDRLSEEITRGLAGLE